MEIGGKLTAEDLEDLARLARSRRHWLCFLAAHWYGIGLVTALAAATFAASFDSRERTNWLAITLVWGVVAAISAWSWFSAKRAQARDWVGLNESLPDTIDVGPTGVVLRGPGDESCAMPWSSFVGWREGSRVVALERRTGPSSVVLPVCSLLEADRERLRSILRLHLGRRR